MKTYTCHHCGAIHSSVQPLHSCSNCHCQYSIEMTADESLCTFRLIRTSDTVTLEVKEPSDYHSFVWEGDIPFSNLHDKIAEVLAKWLSQSVNRP